MIILKLLIFVYPNNKKKYEILTMDCLKTDILTYKQHMTYKL